MPSLAPKRRSLLVRTVGPVVGGIAAIAAIAGLLWGVAVYATDRQRDEGSGFDTRIGDEAFEVQYDELLRRIERDDAPVLFPDLLVGGHLHIYVNHIGSTPQEGWVAFEAKREGADPRCTLEWKRTEDHFLDPCTRQTFPPDGTGLRQFPTEIDEDGDLVVRLRPGRTDEAPVATTSTVPSVGG